MVNRIGRDEWDILYEFVNEELWDDTNKKNAASTDDNLADNCFDWSGDKILSFLKTNEHDWFAILTEYWNEDARLSELFGG